MHFSCLAFPQINVMESLILGQEIIAKCPKDLELMFHQIRETPNHKKPEDTKYLWKLNIGALNFVEDDNCSGLWNKTVWLLMLCSIQCYNLIKLFLDITCFCYGLSWVFEFMFVFLFIELREVFNIDIWTDMLSWTALFLKIYCRMYTAKALLSSS